MKKNCWEMKNCGRQPGGPKASELGVCPAASLTVCNGLNGGINGGRICWALAGTLCGGKVQGTYASKVANCMVCEVFDSIRKEEGGDFRLNLPSHVSAACR